MGGARINFKMKQKTSLQICFGTRHHPVSVPQGPRRAGQRLLGIGSDRQTHAQERREDAERGRGRLDQVGHGSDADPSTRCRRIRPSG